MRPAPQKLTHSRDPAFDNTVFRLYYLTSKCSIVRTHVSTAAGSAGTILVSNGVHNINAIWLQVNQPLTIRGVNGPDVTALKAANVNYAVNKYRRVMLVNHPGAFISGFTLSNGWHDAVSTDGDGPGALRLLSGTVSNCVVRDNMGSGLSGGVQVGGGLLTHCVLFRNTAYRSGGIVGYGGGATVAGGTVRSCVITNNTAQNSGSGLYQTGGLVQDCLIADNAQLYGDTGSGGGGVRLTGGRIENCRMERNVGGYANTTDRPGGGLYQTGGEALACTLADNTVYGLGGGAYLTGGALRNSLVAGNRSSTTTGHGHGLYLNGSAARLENVTVADNSYGTTGSGVYLANGRMTNSIAWFNGTSDLNQTGGSIGYSCWSGAAASNGNTGADPRFMDRARGDYRLSGASPCVNKGVDYLWTAADRDLAGNPRILFKVCDMGAYECTAGTSTLLILR